MPDSLLYSFCIGTLSVIAFFLIRFYYMVDEMRKDIKELLINESKNEQVISRLAEDITEIKLSQREMDKRIDNLELKVK